MRICAATASFRSCNLEEAVSLLRALGFQAIDLDGAVNGQLDREKVLSGSVDEVRRVRGLEVTIPNLHWTFAEFSLSPAVNDPDPSVRASNGEIVRRLLDFCHESGILSVLILPGIFHPGQTASEARQLAMESFQQLLPLAEQANVQLMTEPHLGSAFASPQSAMELARGVPGLGIVLDYAHFICQGYPQATVDPLCGHAAHVHVRQAKNGRLQTPLEAGTIDFALVLDQLRQAGYTGYVCTEYVHQNFLGADNVDVVTETIKMRDFLNRWLQQPGGFSAQRAE